MIRTWRIVGIIAFWASWPALYLRLRRSARVRIVVLHQGNVLLVRNWYNSGQWQLPGGGIRQDESMTESAQRELAEEVGIELQPEDFNSLGKQFAVRERGLPFRCQPVIAHVGSEDFSIKKREIVDGKWLPISRAMDAAGLSNSTLATLELVEKHR